MTNPVQPEGVKFIRTYNFKDQDLVFDEGTYIPLVEIDNVFAVKPDSVDALAKSDNIRGIGWLCLSVSIVDGVFFKSGWTGYIFGASIIFWR